MTQKELKALYKTILENEVWNTADMVDYCVKKANHIVELENGDIVVIEKPTIKKDFCFGYSDSRYDTEDYDRANEMAAHARTSEEYFISENLKQIDNMIEDLINTHSYKAYKSVNYYNQPKDSKLKSVRFVKWFEVAEPDWQELTENEVTALIKGYEIVKENFIKRLNTYLKKYGLSKVNSWSYWQDA